MLDWHKKELINFLLLFITIVTFFQPLWQSLLPAETRRQRGSIPTALEIVGNSMLLSNSFPNSLGQKWFILRSKEIYRGHSTEFNDLPICFPSLSVGVLFYLQIVPKVRRILVCARLPVAIYFLPIKRNIMSLLRMFMYTQIINRCQVRLHVALYKSQLSCPLPTNVRCMTKLIAKPDEILYVCLVVQ